MDSVVLLLLYFGALAGIAIGAWALHPVLGIIAALVVAYHLIRIF